MPGATPECGLDTESARWVDRLSAQGRARELAVRDLHDLLLRAARREVRRRGAGTAVSGRELDDLATQAADDATYALLGKVDQFRGESRFTTGKAGQVDAYRIRWNGSLRALGSVTVPGAMGGEGIAAS
jgi:hypothetical protein